MRPVLVGIDPGGSGAEPLSPDYPSGARLARLARASRDEFLYRFDRINLHASGEDCDDALAARNLIPILRGRRVVALGRRVSRAIDASDGPIGEWSVRPGGYVGCYLPHPSGLNRWWNDPGNVRAAEDLMGSVDRPCLHVEGPDGSGKSTLVRYLSGSPRGLEVLPTEGPARSWSECLSRVNRRVRPGIVCDRSSGLVSELVYGPIVRGRALVDEKQIWSVVGSILHAVTFVYCCTPLDHLRHSPREGEDVDHVMSVDEKMEEIYHAYRGIMAKISAMGGRVLSYDYTVNRPSDVSPCVV